MDLGGNTIDTTSVAGRFMLVVLAGAAEMECNLTRERTRSALAVKRANGQRISGRIPYGHDLADDGVTLTENPAEQAVIRDIQAMVRAVWRCRRSPTCLLSGAYRQRPAGRNDGGTAP